MDLNQEQERQRAVTTATPTDVESRIRSITDAEQRLAAYAGHQENSGHPMMNLGTAENILLYDSLQANVLEKIRFEPDDVRYPKEPYGEDKLLFAVANFLQSSMSEPNRIDSENIHATVGVSGALECLAFALKDKAMYGDKALKDEDQVLMPAPRWQGFQWCFEQRPNLKCVYIKLSAKDDFKLTLEKVQDEYKKLSPKPKLLVLTNPNNPLGINYPRELLESIYDWVLRDTEMHIISDEIYAHSQLSNPKTKFCSAFDLEVYSKCPQGFKERVHVVWGLAKDFGLSGFRVGFIISKSDKISKIINGDEATGRHAMTWFSPLDSLKNVVVKKLFQTGSHSYPIQLMNQYKEALTDSYNKIKRELEKAGIPYFHDSDNDNPAQFFLLDLRKYIKPTQGWSNRRPGGSPKPVLFSEISCSEHDLFNYIEETANVVLLPGQTLNCSEEGHFRMCFTAYNADDVSTAVRRIGKALSVLPKVG